MDETNPGAAADSRAAAASPRRFARAARAARDHGYIVPAFAAALCGFAWMISRGTWDMCGDEAFTRFYDAQAESLLAGRWDVPPHIIGSEWFIRDGKTYGYFGFAPALLRMPLNAAMPVMAGHWSRLIMTAACGVSLVYAYLIIILPGADSGPPRGFAGRAACAGFVLAAGLGSTLLFLASRAYVYHEAAIWGGAFAVGSYYHLAVYLRRPTWPPLVAAGGLGFLSFFSRASVGSGTVLALLLIAAFAIDSRFRRRASGPPRVPIFPPVPPAHAAAAAGMVAAIVALFVAVNHAKFGTYVEAAPLRLYGQMIHDPARLARTGGKQMSLVNVRSGFAAYFNPTHLRLSSAFPWVYCVDRLAAYPEARYDLVEPYASLPASMPALGGLAAAGLLSLARRPGRGVTDAVPILCSLAGGATVLAADAVSERYLHDFFPFLVVAGAAGVRALLAARRPAVRRLLWAAGIPALLFSIVANGAITLYFQRVVVWGVPRAPRAEFRQWQRAVDMWITGSARPAEPVGESNAIRTLPPLTAVGDAGLSSPTPVPVG